MTRCIAAVENHVLKSKMRCDMQAWAPERLCWYHLRQHAGLLTDEDGKRVAVEPYYETERPHRSTANPQS